MHNGDYTQANSRFLFVRANSEFKPVFESLLIQKKKEKKKGRKAFLHCAALHSRAVCQQPCCSDGAALRSCRGRDSNSADGNTLRMCVGKEGGGCFLGHWDLMSSLVLLHLRPVHVNRQCLC